MADQMPAILHEIGSTPLERVEGIWAKLEFRNPSGSVKDRVALYIIDRAEREGRLSPGDTVVEASSGNTANALSMVCAAKGYRMIAVTPRGLSPERTAISRGYGATVVEAGDFHLAKAVAEAKAMARHHGYFCPEQFDSDWNVEENRVWLGQEILDQLPEAATPDAFVMGVGTGGSLIGVSRALRTRNPDLLVVAVEPAESKTMLDGEVCLHGIQGIADGFVPSIVERNWDEIDLVLPVRTDDAVHEMRRLARERGLFVGPSSGANMLAARDVRARYPRLKNVVTLLPDTGLKYLRDHFS